MDNHSQPRPPPGTTADGGYEATGYPHPAGTAYPYAAQAPQPQGHPAYYFNTTNPTPYYVDPNAAQRATFIRRIFVVFIAATIITGTIMFIVWLIIRPQIPLFRVDSLTLSNFNATSSTSLISGNWDARFTVRNPNSKSTLYYYNIEAGLLYKSETLSETSVPPFVQGTKSETAVRASFAASSAYVDKKYMDGITADVNGGAVNFNVRMLARVRFKVGGWRTRRRFLRVFCPDLAVGVSANRTGGSLLGGSKQCRVAL